MNTTTPFLTIDPVVSDRLLDVYSALDGGDWKLMINNHDELRIRLVSQGIEDPETRSSMTWDDANLFFVSCIDLTRNGRPYPLETGVSKEKFGRFPYGDGSSISYLRDWIRDSRRDAEHLEEMTDLLEKLNSRMSGTSMEKGVDMEGRIQEMFEQLNADALRLQELFYSERKHIQYLDQQRCAGYQVAVAHPSEAIPPPA